MSTQQYKRGIKWIFQIWLAKKNIRTFIEDLLNKIIATAIETALKEKTAIGTIEENTAIDEDVRQWLTCHWCHRCKRVVAELNFLCIDTPYLTQIL